MTRASAEPREGWGPQQLAVGQHKRLGYAVTEYRVLGRSVLAITAAAAPQTDRSERRIRGSCPATYDAEAEAEIVARARKLRRGPGAAEIEPLGAGHRVGHGH